MRAPSLRKRGADLLGRSGMQDATDPRSNCPLARIPEHRCVLRLDSGRPAATLCELCGQAVTREQWLALLEECAR